MNLDDLTCLATALYDYLKHCSGTAIVITAHKLYTYADDMCKSMYSKQSLILKIAKFLKYLHKRNLLHVHSFVVYRKRCSRIYRLYRYVPSDELIKLVQTMDRESFVNYIIATVRGRESVLCILIDALYDYLKLSTTFASRELATFVSQRLRHYRYGSVLGMVHLLLGKLCRAELLRRCADKNIYIANEQLAKLVHSMNKLQFRVKILRILNEVRKTTKY